MTKKTLTVVSPVYNEELVIGDFYVALRSSLDAITAYESTITFVVDRSTDDTLSILRDIARKDSSVRVLALSSRFGYQMSLLAGIDHADGDVIITMDSDMQNPPSLIPRFLSEYEKGADIVSGVREDTEDLSLLRKMQSNVFYRFLNLISDVPITKNAADFRLISRRVADVIRTSVHERDLFLRGIFSWMGFTQAQVLFMTPKRLKGRSKFGALRLLQFALTGLVSFSKKPLRAAIFVGVGFAFLGLCFIVFTLIEYVMYGTFPPGWATVVILLSVFSSIQLIFLGVLGEYIGVIFDEVKARPRYLIDEFIGSTSPGTK